MKTLPITLLLLLLLTTTTARAASDADVTILKAESVVIEEDVITIVAEARTRITLIHGDGPAKSTQDQWLGRPVMRVEVKSDKATFITRNPRDKGLEKAWQQSLQAARELKDSGKPVGIGYYSPDMSIKGNLITSITGKGYLRRP